MKEISQIELNLIPRLYSMVCDEYAIGVDEDGVSAISRLSNARTKKGRETFDPSKLSPLEKKFLKFDCAFISAERSVENGGTDEQNSVNTCILKEELSKLKDRKLLTFCESIGWYQEIGASEPTSEHGFFCSDLGPQYASKFFAELYQLSFKFDQDSFLYKSAGGKMTRTGYFICTNANTMKKYKNGYWKAGELYIGLHHINYWTELEDPVLGNKGIFFCENKPSEEDLAYSRR